ncbi:hypothetical protein PHLGIDRAFT_471407 [Phlebiopsis gigantea 11061_1 CR5-6]|uniref:Uncharacterized protein n=1 Tax=Phlebiopsis gigantea (strain 11061_1 CR5-6) TaxID=745531 RepID=A0A0C3S9C6_PHLG1|nr:hypothetical protein PHLGIDRAFT_471407 [Phlebiopsis gigantea 11061_1 CR5-6]
MPELHHTKKASPSEVYATALAPLLEGYALWYPEPHASGEVRLCDVGYIRDGAFVRILNASPDTERSKVDFWTPRPDELTPLSYSSIICDTRNKAFAPGVYRSEGLEETEGQLQISPPGCSVNAALNIGYSCNAEQGALLMLNGPGNKEVLFDKDDIRGYILDNHDYWYHYARSVLQLRIQHEDLVFVRGYVKTSPDWLVASFSSTGSKIKASLNAASAAFGSANLTVSNTRAHRGSPIVRFGRNLYENPESLPKEEPNMSQCILVQRYVVKKTDI